MCYCALHAHSIFVVSPAVAHGRHGRVLAVAVVVIVVRAMGSLPEWAETRGTRGSGPRPQSSSAIPCYRRRRGLEPGRGPLGPRGAEIFRQKHHISLATDIGEGVCTAPTSCPDPPVLPEPGLSC